MFSLIVSVTVDDVEQDNHEVYQLISNSSIRGVEITCDQPLLNITLLQLLLICCWGREAR